MGIIRFSDDEVFSTDSHEYDILVNAALRIKDVPGAIVEIGTRRGGSAKMIIDALHQNADSNRHMFCIDPYGNIDYEYTNKAAVAHNINVNLTDDVEEMVSTDIVNKVKLNYDNSMRNRIVPSLYYYAFQKGIDFQFFFLEDTEFFNRYSDGVPVYNNVKSLVNDYSLVFFDGPHTNGAIKNEIEFFEPRMSKGSIMIFDDIWMMDHDRVVEECIFPRGWSVLEKREIKASYIKEDS